jgi:hypothetical protein
MTDVLEAPPTTAAVHPRRRHAFGLASLVLGAVVWLSYGAMIVTVAVLVLAVPSWLVLLVEFTQATGVPFVILTGGPWGFMFGVMGLAGVVGLIAFVVYVCATALCALAVVYGTAALVQREKRAFAVTGILLSVLVLALNVALFVLASTSMG